MVGVNFDETKSTTQQTARTNIEVENPRVEDNSCNYADSLEEAQMYWQAATQAKNLPEPREALVGEFLHGVNQSWFEDNDDYLLEVVEALTGRSVEYVDEEDE